MNRFKSILVATDTRQVDHPIIAAAAAVAVKNHSTLKIVDVVPEFPSSVRRSLPDHEHLLEMMKKEKHEQLEALATPIRNQGLDVATEVLYGKTSVEIIREVLRARHDLVMRVAKGQDSRQKGFFGSTGFRLLRNCPVPVWLVSPKNQGQFKHVLGCVDTSREDEVDDGLNNDVVELTTSLADHLESRHSILYCWSMWNKAMVKSRLQPDVFADWENQDRRHAEKRFGSFLQKHGLKYPSNRACLGEGEPHVVIPEFIAEHDVDLVVLGTVGRSGLYGMIMGNTAERILNRITCSVLTLKPYSFHSPIKLD